METRTMSESNVVGGARTMSEAPFCYVVGGAVEARLSLFEARRSRVMSAAM